TNVGPTGCVFDAGWLALQGPLRNLPCRLGAVKVTTPILLASVAANIALVAVVVTRRSAAVDPAPASVSRVTPAPAGINSDAVRAALASGDLAALQAAGFSAETAREILLGRSFARVAEKLRAAQGNANDDRWWRRNGAN